MGGLLKFVCMVFLILLVLALAIPLLWLVIKMVCWLFGGMLAGLVLGGGDILWILITIVSVIFIIWCLTN